MKHSKHGTLKRFLLSYLIIFTIPFITGIFVYFNLVEIIEEDSKEYNLTMLEQCKDLMDNRMQEVNGIVVQLSNSSVLDDLMFRVNFSTGEAYYEMQRLWKQISVFSYVNNFIYDFFIYQSIEDFLVSQQEVYTHINEAYGSKIEYGDKTLEQFESLLMQKSSKSFLPENLLTKKYGTQVESTNVIGFRRSLPLNSITPRGSITFFIPTANIQNILKNMYSKEGGSSFVLDDTGKVLISYPEGAVFPEETILSNMNTGKASDIVINGKKTVLYQVRSKYNGLTYISLMPYSVLMNRVSNIEGIMFVSVFAMLLVGIVLSYTLAYRNSKPIAEMVRLIASNASSAKGHKRNDFDFIKGSISELLNSNQALQSEIQQQFVLLRNDFYGKLLRSGFNSRQEIDTYLLHINEKMPDGPYLTLIIQLQGLGRCLNEDSLLKASTIKLLLHNIFEKQLDNLICFYDYDFDKAVVLLTTDRLIAPEGENRDFRSSLESQILNIDALMMERFQVCLSFTVGMQVDDVMRVGDSVNTALRTLQACMLNDKIRWFSDLPERPEIHYSVDTEAKILNLSRAGCYSEIEGILNELFQECFVRRRPSGPILKQLVHDLKGTVFQIAVGELPADSSVTAKIYRFIDELDPRMQYDMIWKELLAIYRDICSFFNDQKRSRNSQLGNQLQEYIKQHYRDTQLSLSGVACHFNMTEVYLSQFFKEQTGQMLPVAA